SHRLVACQLLPALAGTLRKAAQAQTAASQALLACALERYRLAHGQSPESLAQLTPQFLSQLPNDVLTGRPYKYQRNKPDQSDLSDKSDKSDSGLRQNF